MVDSGRGYSHNFESIGRVNFEISWKNIVSRKMPLKFSIAVTMTLVLRTTITSLILEVHVFKVTEIYF